MLKYFCVHYIFCAKSKLCALENNDYKKCKNENQLKKIITCYMFLETVQLLLQSNLNPGRTKAVCTC